MRLPLRLLSAALALGAAVPALAQVTPAPKVRPKAPTDDKKDAKKKKGPAAPPQLFKPAAPAAPGAPGGAAAKPALPEPKKHDASVGRKDVKLDLHFDKAPILDVVKWISDWTDKNFIIPDRGISGNITIWSPVKVTPDEAYAAFLAALDANGLAVYPVGKYFKLGTKQDVKKGNMAVYTADDTGPLPLDERFVTKVVKLNYIEGEQAKAVLNNFVGKDGDFQSVAFSPQTVIITDTALNIHRLEKILDQIDAPGGSDEIRVLQVEYAGAQEIAQKLTDIFQKQGGPGGAAGGARIGFAEPAVAQPVGMATPGGQPGGPGQGAVTVTKILPDERTNKIIVIASPRAFDRIASLLKQLDVPTSGEGQVHVYYLENAKAEEISATLQALEQGGRGKGATAPGGKSASAELFSGEVKVTADKSTNSLVIVAQQNDYRSLTKVIEKLDLRRRQVFVEAVIMEVNLKGENKLGVSTHAGAVIPDVSIRGQHGPVPIIIGSEPDSPGESLSLASLLSLGGFLAGVQGPAVSTALNINLPSFGFILNASQTDSDVNVLSTPHILTSDNQEAEITVGQNVPFLTNSTGALSSLSGLAGAAGVGGNTGAPGGIGGLGALGGLGSFGGLGGLFPQVQRQNVELKLKIKPQINESDYIRMEVEEQTEEIASVDPNLGPTTAKRSAKTTIVAKDQQTVVIGGLVQERATNAVTKTPILGSIPIIGWLFRNSSVLKQKTNLLLFLTPYIIRDQADFRRIFEQKMKEREEFVRRFYGETSEYKVAIDYTRKIGPLTDVVKTIDKGLARPENGGTDGSVIGPARKLPRGGGRTPPDTGLTPSEPPPAKALPLVPEGAPQTPDNPPMKQP